MFGLNPFQILTVVSGVQADIDRAKEDGKITYGEAISIAANAATRAMTGIGLVDATLFDAKRKPGPARRKEKLPAA